MAGDLNLKKAWHPLTRANLEKVYLAEKEAEEEQKQIGKLKEQKKQEQEKKDLRDLREKAGLSLPKADRLDWMYQGSEQQESKRPQYSSLHETSISRNVKSKDSLRVSNEVKLRKCDEWSKSKEDPMFK